MKNIPWWQPKFGKKEVTLISQVLKHNFPNEGQLTTQFEMKIKKLLDVKHVIAVTSGTAAIYLSLKALDIGSGDEVIVPDLTFIATANAVKMTGASVVFADIDSATLNIDTKLIHKLITKKTKAIIPVHVSGRGANMKEVLKIAKKNNIAIIEDAAEAFMSKLKGKYLGTFGDLGCFSLSAAKVISTGQGGFIVTNNDVLEKKLRELKDQGRPVRGTGGDDIHYSIGFNFKFTDLQAAVGLGQLEDLKFRIQRIKKTYKIYNSLLKSVKEIEVLPFKIIEGEIPQWVDAKCKKRDELVEYLKQFNIDCRKFWHPIHSQKPYKINGKFFPNTTFASKESLWLPSAFTLKDDDIVFVCQKIKDFFKN